MNKGDLKNFVADEAGVTKAEANLMIDVILAGIKEGLLEDGKVTLVGFGTFSAVARKARKARNPQTGAAIDVPAKMVPKFKPAAALKDLVLELGLPVTEDEVEEDEVEETEDETTEE